MKKIYFNPVTKTDVVVQNWMAICGESIHSNGIGGQTDPTLAPSKRTPSF